MDRELLTAIYDGCHLAIYRNIYRQVGDVEAARDLTADVFQRLIAAVQKGKGPSKNERAWLFRTAHNIVIDYYRRQKFRDHLPLSREPADKGLDPLQVVENRIMVESIRVAMTKLTPEQQAVLNLKLLEGLSTTEVAAVLERSTGAIKGLQHRALTALRRLLEDEKGDEAGSGLVSELAAVI